MSMTVLESSKKRKRNSKYFGLHTFADPGFPISPSGPFRDNIRYFLRECAELEDYNVEGMPIWCTLLVHEKRGFVLPLYTIEENVKNSFQPLCDHCRCSGWSHHLVSKRKYHLIIPIDSEWNKPVNEGVLDLQTHLLHGLIHCNGFGHLLCINGIEGGSKFICGREIMDLWDRICSNLHTRKITVVDLTKKKNMDLRLLYGMAYGHSWFGRWGYRFCHGSFGVTNHKYEKALEILRSLELDRIIVDFQNQDVKKIISRYRDLSETNLFTLGDLLRFMLIALKSRTAALQQKKLSVSTTETSSPAAARPRLANFSQNKEKLGKVKKFSTLTANLDSRWPVRRLEYVASVVVDALREKREENGPENCRMSRQEARDAARLHIGDTGLIDYVLKSMNNVVVGGYVVQRAVNPTTRVLEYSIQEVGNNDSRVNPQTETGFTKRINPVQKFDNVPESDVYDDVAYLYNTVLLDYPESEMVKFAVSTILDSKHFVKEYPFKDDDDEFLRFICRVRNVITDLGTEFTRNFSHGEYVVVPLHSTIGDLREAVQNAMRDTYCVLENLVVSEIDELEGLDDREVIFGLVESGSEISVSGFGFDVPADLKYEGGDDNWTVRCRCGARDDDGERMVACDICEVWQHTCCSGIEDAEAVPPLFVCSRCCDSIAQGKSEQVTVVDYADWMMQGFDYDPILC